MLVPLLLWQFGLVGKPMFYISAYFEVLRDVYYERLLAVSRDDDWTGWCSFFLEAVRIQAEDNLTKAKRILDLYEAMKHQVADMTHSQHAIRALDWIFGRPIFRSSDFVASAGIPPPSARRILAVLRYGGVLTVVQTGSGRRAARLAFPELINIAEGKDIL
jgi:Fic family protein